MCGRFTQHHSWQEIHEYYSLINSSVILTPSYNIAPTQDIAIICATSEPSSCEDFVFVPDEGTFGAIDVKLCDTRELCFARWGLIPSWWKKPLNELPSSINAKAETIDSKPFWRASYRHHRCLIPASGFFEWQGAKSPKQPYFISMADSEPMTFAGLYSVWTDPHSQDEIITATIITTNANEFISPIHKRMPVILQQSDFDNWLTGDPDPDLLRPCPDQWLQAWPVSTKVNSPRNNAADCIENISLV